MPKDDFILDEKYAGSSVKKSKIKIGKAYATALTGFIAGVIVGFLSAYIFLALFVGY